MGRHRDARSSALCRGQSFGCSPARFYCVLCSARAALPGCRARSGYFGRVCCLGPQRKALATTAKIVPIHPSPIAPYTTRKNIAPRGPGSNVARKPNTQNAAIGRQIATRINFSRCFMTCWLLRPNSLESYCHPAGLNTLVCRHSLFALVPTYESRNH